MKKIYIIGPVGSGKTTLSHKLSQKYQIKNYELDKIVFDDDHGNIKRTEEEIEMLFHNIIIKKSWIIEDVGRKKFREGIKKADIVYFLNLKNNKIYIRCIKRWIKQKIGLEKYNYKPTIKSLCNMLKWAHRDIENKNEKIKYIKEQAKKYRVLSQREINELEKEK